MSESAPQVGLKELVMGLHWDPSPEGALRVVDLDAICVLLDARGSVLEVIHPGHARGAGGGVVHTGDSRTGASEWDDERIFVFLDALPAEAAAVAFVVLSSSGRAFHEVPGATCHVSDRISESPWVRLELTQLRDCLGRVVASVRRSAGGWELAGARDAAPGGLLAELRSLLRGAKRADSGGPSIPAQ